MVNFAMIGVVLKREGLNKLERRLPAEHFAEEPQHQGYHYYHANNTGVGTCFENAGNGITGSHREHQAGNEKEVELFHKAGRLD